MAMPHLKISETSYVFCWSMIEDLYPPDHPLVRHKTRPLLPAAVPNSNQCKRQLELRWSSWRQK